MISLEHNSEDLHSELFPLHSPLLRESLLFSFPPPSYMLKFSGYSCLIGGPIGFAAITLISIGISTDVVSSLFVITKEAITQFLVFNS